jgi:signal peptidase I
MEELFEDILKQDLDLRLKVTGRSMRPFIMSGETVILRKIAARSLQCGDIVYYISTSGTPVLHRITDKKILPNGKLTFITKGDALLHNDIPVSEKQMLAKALYVEKVLPVFGTITIKLDSTLFRNIYTLFSFYKNLRQKIFNRTQLRKLFPSRQ